MGDDMRFLDMGGLRCVVLWTIRSCISMLMSAYSQSLASALLVSRFRR